MFQNGGHGGCKVKNGITTSFTSCNLCMVYFVMQPSWFNIWWEISVYYTMFPVQYQHCPNNSWWWYINTMYFSCNALGIAILIYNPPTHVKRCCALTLSVAILQHFSTPFTNRCIYVVVELSNATNGNAYKSVGVDLSNTYMDIRQRIDALLKGGSCCSETMLQEAVKTSTANLQPKP